MSPYLYRALLNVISIKYSCNAYSVEHIFRNIDSGEESESWAYSQLVKDAGNSPTRSYSEQLWEFPSPHSIPLASACSAEVQ